MSTFQDCFANVIGLSRSKCDCYNVPLDAAISKSGYYIDEAEGMNLTILSSMGDCENGDVWEMLGNSKEEAVRFFVTDLMKILNSSGRTKFAYPQLFSQVGDTSGNKPLNNFGKYALAAHRTVMRPIRGGIMRVKRIGLMFNDDTAFTLFLYNNLSDDALATFVVNAEAKKLTWFTPPTPLNLPMYNPGCKYLNYFFMYPVHSVEALNNPMHCGCGSTPQWTYPMPQFTYTRENYRWSEWISAIGTYGNDYLKRESWTCTTEAQGIILDVEFICNAYETICKDELDFTSNHLAMEYAKIIRSKSAELTLSKILMSTDINRFTSMDSETTAKNAAMHLADYEKGIKELGELLIQPENLNINTDCYECLSALNFKKGKILA